MKLQYTVTEYSQDAREFWIDSEKKLSRDEVIEVISSASLNKSSTKVGVEVQGKGKVYVRHVNTVYGDDSQVDISEPLPNTVDDTSVKEYDIDDRCNSWEDDK